MSTIVLNSIPHGHCDEHSVRRALLQYGTAVHIQVLPQQSQAIVEMRTPQEAQNACQRGNIMIAGKPVHVGMSGAGSATHPKMSMRGMGAAPTAYMHPPPAVAANPYPTSYRVNVLVTACVYPVNDQLLREILYSSCGVTPTAVYCAVAGGSGEEQTAVGYVDFADAVSAKKVVQELNNKSIYENCCYMRLTLDSYATESTPQPLHHHHHHAAMQDHAGNGDLYTQSTPAYPPPRPAPSISAYNAMPMAPSMQQAGDWGRRGRGGFGRGRGMGGPQGYGMVASGGYSTYDAFQMMAPPTMEGGYAEGPAVDGTVIINNVSESVPLYDLWVLLEVYGNVNSMKRQFKEKTNVVAQFQNARDAKAAVMYLQGCPFRDGRFLSLKLFAGYVERGGRVEWNAGQATDPATQAVLFTSGYHHRTKPSAPYNPLGQIRPDKNIFVSNLIESITDEQVKALFQAAGFQVVQYYRKNPSVAILSFREVGEAVEALIAVHAKKVQDRYLRITFSRYPPGAPESATEQMNEETTA